MTKPTDEVAALFSAMDEAAGGNRSELVFPGQPGLVLTDGRLRQMTWGFPLVLKGKSGQPLKPKPVNNARTDKLRSFFWRDSFENRRCLIPVTAYAEAQGPKGSKTRTWIDLPGDEVFACAGLWRESDEWGPCYSMVITEASEAVAPVHHRMPVILPKTSWEAWLGSEPADAFRLAEPFRDAITIDATDEPWVAR